MTEATVSVKIQPESGCEDLLPTYGTAGAAGMDLKAARDFRILPGERQLISLGFRIAVPDGWEMQIRARSGLTIKHGIVIAQGVGTVDSDFRGSVMAILANTGSDVFDGQRGDRIAQAVFARAPQITLHIVEKLDDTARGAGGFGSTGVRAA
jgi:dUTP pyrophosphatase